jgi:hypothetical protein
MHGRDAPDEAHPLGLIETLKIVLGTAETLPWRGQNALHEG